MSIITTTRRTLPIGKGTENTVQLYVEVELQQSGTPVMVSHFERFDIHFNTPETERRVDGLNALCKQSVHDFIRTMSIDLSDDSDEWVVEVTIPTEIVGGDTVFTEEDIATVESEAEWEANITLSITVSDTVNLRGARRKQNELSQLLNETNAEVDEREREREQLAE